jgi:hypothetical protein
VTWPSGEAQIKSGIFKDNQLEIHLDTPQGESVLTAKLEKSQLTGEWSSEGGQGAWEGKKQARASKKHPNTGSYLGHPFKCSLPNCIDVAASWW